MKDSKANASLYLITMLVQRMENDKPGMIKEMIEGVKNDKANIDESTPNKDHIEAVFEEALTLLERANSLLSEGGKV